MQGNTKNNFSDAVKIAGQYFAGFGFAGLMIYGMGELFWGASFLSWLTRLLAIGLIGFGTIAWKMPLKPILLPGEDDEWHFILGWHGNKIGVAQAGGMIRITPLQSIKEWRRVNPLLIKVQLDDVHNKPQDFFEVYAKVLLEVHPDQVATTKGLRWLDENYPANLPSIAEGMLKDCIVSEMRDVPTFNLAVEKQTEADLKEKIISKFKGWEANGVLVNENSVFVDVMVPQIVLQKRKETRAELSTLHTIRDVAHEMGISTDELLIQRTLERLPDNKNKQSISEITMVLQMLRNAATPPLAELPAVSATLRPQAGDIEEPPPMPPKPVMLDEPPIIPTTFREGTYIAKDDYDPDADGDSKRGIYSPF